ncbi:MAG: hypothetical protein NT108_02495 [Candidatus Kaiserbacteria bacterium]|nr:hypothetical protein [Candidatus Kaiserbacteria bacterium]
MDDKPRITIADFSKIEVKIGTVRSAERVPETDKLLRLMVDFGLKPSQNEGVERSPEASAVGEERDVRQIVSGIAAYVPEPETLIGRQLAFVTNLEPRTIRGLESNGMLFAVGTGETFAFLTPDREVPPGTSAH